jgi:dCMP deaminase
VEKWKVIPEAPPGFLLPVRQSLQFIGDGFRKIQSNIWIDLAIRNMDFPSICSDCRYINELRTIHERGGLTVLVWRPGKENDDQNGSEAQIRPLVDWFVATGKEGWVYMDSPQKATAPLGCEFVDLFIRNEGSVDDLLQKVDDFIIPSATVGKLKLIRPRKETLNYQELLKQAYEIATKSPDPSTQNGALLVTEQGFPVAGDINRFPKGVHDRPERWEKPLKYEIIEHAERNVIYKVGRAAGTEGLTMICPWACCANCARGIIEAGIIRLVTHKQAHDRSPAFWKEQIEIAFTMLREAGVEIIMYDGPVGGPEVRHSGQTWMP